MPKNKDKNKDLTPKIKKRVSKKTKFVDYKKEFLRNLSHELKNPITIIQSYLYTIIDENINDLEIIDKFLRKAYKATIRMEKIIKDLETISSFELHEVNIEKKPNNLIESINQVISELDEFAIKKKIKFIKKFTETELILNYDDNKIEQILINLLLNAIYYSDEKSNIEIIIKNRTKSVKISVKDYGIGIKEENLKKISERFYRVDDSRERNKNGSGIGLSIVKHILKAHKSKLNIESIYGKESIFSFVLRK